MTHLFCFFLYSLFLSFGDFGEISICIQSDKFNQNLFYCFFLAICSLIKIFSLPLTLFFPVSNYPGGVAVVCFVSEKWVGKSWQDWFPRLRGVRKELRKVPWHQGHKSVLSLDCGYESHSGDTGWSWRWEAAGQQLWVQTFWREKGGPCRDCLDLVRRASQKLSKSRGGHGHYPWLHLEWTCR